MTDTAPGPLSGLRVLDLTAVVLGPFATQALGDLGADVIKVEGPAGDDTRSLGYSRNPGMGSLFLGLNRNKRSIALDLKRPEGRAALLKLAASCDAMVHNMRPAAIRRLGLGYEEVRKARPDIVYAAAYGYSEAGPLAGRAAYDGAMQAGLGLAALNAGADGVATSAPTILCDKTTGLMLYSSVLAALIHRLRTGQGQRLEVTMYETLAWWLSIEHLHGRTFEPPMGGSGWTELQGNRRAYPASDGGQFFAVPHTDAQWAAVFERGGGEALRDPRFASREARYQNMAALIEAASAVFRTRPAAEWIAYLAERGVPVSPVQTMDDLTEDPQLGASGLWRRIDHPSEGALRLARFPVEFSATPAQFRRPPPRHGEHTAELLDEAGLAAAEIERLLGEGIARGA
jgi:crotonobetainyl-CoA:carnitine CoA-transferase CaiB-like acyl-CoA transferase